MKTHLLVVPSKETEELNWIKPLNNYLLSLYGNTSNYQTELSNFNKLRQDIRGVNADNTGLRLYYTYYSQVELLDLRIPWSKIRKVEFEWFEAFGTGPSHKQKSLAFEKASILFNIASLLSKFAKSKYDESSQDDKAEQGTKMTIQLFQTAAGIYEFINENFLHAPSDDLAQSTIKFLQKLMLAQSQEVFTLRLMNTDLEQKKNSLVAKLCASASTYYEECYNMIGQDKKELFAYYDGDDDNDSGYEEMESLSKPEANYVAANLDLSWVGTIYFKYIYFKSLAYYFNGLQLEANKKYGSSIAYLTKSKDIIKQVHSITLRAISKGHGDVYELLDNYKYQKDALEIKLNDLNKDNDLIYHDIVPSLVTLPEIKPMDSTKIIRINENAMLKEINEQNYNNFLNNVVPFNIHELSSLYSEEKSQFLRNELDLVEVSNEETSSILEYLKLPKSLVEIKELINKDTQPFEIPNEILTKVREVSSNFDQDETNKQQIDGIRKQIFEKISEIERLGQSLFSGREETIQLKKALYEATNSDNKLFSLIDRPLYEILSKGPQSKSFKQLFAIETEHQPEVSLLDIDETTDNQAIMTKIKRIEDLLHDIHSVKSNKMKLVEDLKKEIHSDDISNILILNSKLKSENEIKSVIFPEELKKFAPFNEQLDWLIKQEKKFVSELRSAWESLNLNKEIKKIISKQTRMDSKIIDENGRIQQFYDNWSKYHVGLSKGKQFYQGLLDQCIRVKNEIEQGLKFDEQFKNMKVSEAPPTFSNQYQQQYQAAPAPTAQYQQPIVNRSSTGEFPSQQQPLNFYRPENQPKPPSFSGLDNQNFPPSINRQPSLPRQYENDSGSFTRGGLNEYMQQQPPQLPPQPIINRASTGGSFNYGQGYQSPQSTGYVRPPQLPPKQRMQGDLQPSIPMMPQQQIMPPQQQQPQQQPPLFNQKTPNSNRSESNLIYDQPSTYNPNMYNFFSSSNAK